MERQGAQVKRLEANHAHLISRNNFKVLIFQVGLGKRGPTGLFGFKFVTLFGHELLKELTWKEGCGCHGNGVIMG